MKKIESLKKTESISTRSKKAKNEQNSKESLSVSDEPCGEIQNQARDSDEEVFVTMKGESPNANGKTRTYKRINLNLNKMCRFTKSEASAQ